jgi:xylitol oxidase
MTYARIAQALEGSGLALHNLASLPHVTVAGAVATGTHGSGDRNGSLATAVAGIELVSSSGGLLRMERGDPEFEGVVVNLGALGAVVRMTLDVEPAYEVRQTVFEHLSWPALFDHFDEVTGSGYSVSLFTTYGREVEQVWLKTRSRDAAPEVELFGARAAQVQLHPVPGVDPSNCTPQLGRPGAWWQRLPHFRVEFQPSVGNELQSEYMVERRHALAAIEAIRRMQSEIRPLLQVAEIRTVAADRLWLSPEYGRESVCLHFTWAPDQAAVEAVLLKLEATLAPFDARPHWGKLFAAKGERLRGLYPRLAQFVHLVERMDPRRAFRNDWFVDHILGSGSGSGSGATEPDG